MRDCLNDILNENLLLTLAPINREPTIHDPTVARAFERMLLRKKLVRAFPADKNRQHVIQIRAGYTNLFMRYVVVNHSFFCGRMRLQYLDCKKWQQGRKREEGIPAGLWRAWEKRHNHNGNFPNKWPYFPFWDPWRNDTQRFNDFLQQARHNLDPDEHVIFIYDGAPALRNPANPGPNSELKMLPPYSGEQTSEQTLCRNEILFSGIEQHKMHKRSARLEYNLFQDWNCRSIQRIFRIPSIPEYGREST